MGRHPPGYTILTGNERIAPSKFKSLDECRAWWRAEIDKRYPKTKPEPHLEPRRGPKP
jgi:hypothetical protein